VLLLIHLLSEAMPLGFKFSALIAMFAMIGVPFIGAVWGALFAYMDRYIATPNEYLASGFVNGAIAMIAAPFFVAYYRRKRPVKHRQ
jgi:hypothetical protein